MLRRGKRSCTLETYMNIGDRLIGTFVVCRFGNTVPVNHWKLLEKAR